MRTRSRSRLSLLFLSFALVLALPATALADQVANNLDSSVDTILENMPLNEGGPAGATTIYVNPANGDGKPGCNLQGDQISVSVASSDTNVATVSPSNVTLSGCGVSSGKLITVTPVKAGTATITLNGPSSINSGSLTYEEGTFTVTVAAPANTAPSVHVTGAADKSQYEYGSVPQARCSVEDKEDGNKTFDATLGAISGPLASYGLGNQTASCEYTDAGGLKASAAATYEIVDTTAPVIKDAGTRQSANANGWFNADVTNDFTASDNVALADAGQASFSKTTSGEGTAVKVSSGTVMDVAGNEAVAVDSQGFQIDKTAPTLDPGVSPNPVLLNGSATATAGAEDNLSGIESQSCDSVNTSSVGAKSVSCSATDNAGNQNSANAQYNVNYKFAGYRAPVDNGGVFNVAKAGSSIPMKFSLFGNQGLGVITAGFPKASAVACSASATTDTIEQTTTSNSGLTYDGSIDQYNYVWKTQSTYAGKCIKFDMVLTDGTSHTALFKFTK